MRIVVFEVHDCNSDIFDKIMEIVESHPDVECLRVKDEPILSLPGLEIYSGRRKINRDRREINLTAKEYDLLCLLAANRGQLLIYEQIYRRVWGEDTYGDEGNAIGCHIRHPCEILCILLTKPALQDYNNTVIDNGIIKERVFIWQ